MANANMMSDPDDQTQDKQTDELALLPSGEPAADAGKTEAFFGDDIFDWQFPNPDHAQAWQRYSYSETDWWGSFPPGPAASPDMPADYPWALGPFTKYADNPVLLPTPGKWDQGRHDGGVHNGSIIIKENKFYYIYRGEQPIDIEQAGIFDYICDIGIAVSDDGKNFVKLDDYSPLFRHGEDRRFSYEDVSIAQHGDTYYLFCNQWDWEHPHDTSRSGTFLATSQDLLHWEKVGLVFPKAAAIHRNGVVLQDPHNEAVRVNGRFVMYLNHGLMAFSEDMLHWESQDVGETWPGGEGCFALANYAPDRPDDILLFTGGPHTGHFYAVGEVLFSKSNPSEPLAYLPRPVLSAETWIPHENGFAFDDPTRFVSCYADCIFFNGLTQHEGKWWLYYGGSEYYTCLATSDADREFHSGGSSR